ncbi:FGGY-family carbohydrate kinase [Nostoc sp. CENA67]|uniref:FGGY-family carbohydrate kinase n=1 Tax=Amazonocrinis nigriterrae CENA67 TaxID=2794033 RepID=A0A8J7I165_9NOST|nr:FGGY-family carbohydrate kinase [Amazonocrinis nigriterrae]MBH8566973.1 FGGY-family carbohydrate kinase [Amazonocrinis nigriterrae CENA67]
MIQKTPLVIGIDCSTTACKAIAWSREGKAVAEGRAAIPLLQPQANWYEQDAWQWWNSTCQAIKQLLTQIDKSQIEAVCITHQRETFVAVDKDGKPVRNAIVWMDKRSRNQVAFLKNKIELQHFNQLTGKPVSMTPSLPKILWFSQNEPENIARTDKFLDVHGFLVYHLTGNFRTSLASADPMGTMDMQAHHWATDLLTLLELQAEQFAELMPPGEIIGYVNDAGALATGLPTGLPIIAGAGDGQCAGLGANAVGNGRAYLNLGTAIASGIITNSYTVNSAFRTMYAPIAGSYFLETVLLGGVFTITWFVEKFASDLQRLNLNLSPEEILETAAAKLSPGADGLMLVPYWNHVMNPYWDTSASGITIGWNGNHSREHFYRAILEGIAFEQRLVGDAVMSAINQDFSEYVVMGGGSKSNLWCQIIADVTGIPIVRSTTVEATCLGAGILAAVAIGWYSDINSACLACTGTAERFTPNHKSQLVYDKLYSKVYQPLFPTIQSLVNKLTDISMTDD